MRLMTCKSWELQKVRVCLCYIFDAYFAISHYLCELPLGDVYFDCDGFGHQSGFLALILQCNFIPSSSQLQPNTLSTCSNRTSASPMLSSGWTDKSLPTGFPWSVISDRCGGRDLSVMMMYRISRMSRVRNRGRRGRTALARRIRWEQCACGLPHGGTFESLVLVRDSSLSENRLIHCKYV